MPMKATESGWGIRPRSGNAIAEGGGRPRCGVLIFSDTLVWSGGKTLLSALKECLWIGLGGGSMKSWACLNSNSNLAGGGSVSNIGSEAPMWRVGFALYEKNFSNQRCKIQGRGTRKKKIKERE